MSLLISVLFVLLVSIYVLSVHKNDYSFAPYVSGLIAGVCVLPLALLLKTSSYTTPNFFAYSFAYFSFYHLLSSMFGLLLYFLLNIRAFNVQTMPCALCGIWSVFFFFAAYDFSRSPENITYIIFLLSYSASFLFYDVLVMLFRSLPTILTVLLSYPLLLIFSYLSTFSFAAWLYKSSALIYIGLPLISIFVFLALAILLAHKNDSQREREGRLRRQSSKNIFEEIYDENYKEASL